MNSRDKQNDYGHGNPLTHVSEEDLRKMYGEDIVISRVGNFNLIHLDHPNAETIARRVREFDPQTEFPDNCPLCQQMRDRGCDVVFDPEED